MKIMECSSTGFRFLVSRFSSASLSSSSVSLPSCSFLLFLHTLYVSLSRPMCLFVTAVCLFILGLGEQTRWRDGKTHGLVFVVLFFLFASFLALSFCIALILLVFLLLVLDSRLSETSTDLTDLGGHNNCFHLHNRFAFGLEIFPTTCEEWEVHF